MSNQLFDYCFSTSERGVLIDLFTSLKSPSPYVDYHSFREFVKNILANTLPAWLRDLFNEIKNLDYSSSPAVILRNCPTDKNNLIFGHEDPVAEKYQLKDTFVAEGFLQIYSLSMGSDPIAYKSINNGDYFHDVYPKQGLLDSQSQKSSITLGFHNDLPNSLVRPDWVNILCMRSSSLNRVSTTIIRNRDVIDALSDPIKEILGQPIFYTPHEVISIHGGKNAVEGMQKKAIYQTGKTIEFCYFEGRTVSDTDDGVKAIAELDKVLHEVKIPVFLESSDFVSISNNLCLHAREVISVIDYEAHMKRWLIKTFDTSDAIASKNKFTGNKINFVDE